MASPGRITRVALRWLVVLGAVTACVPNLAWAERRHHITFGLGYTKMLSDDLKDESIGVDFTNAANAVLAYRYSLNSSVDLTIDSRGTASTDSYGGVDLMLTTSFFGPGVRWRAATGSAPVYVQGNVFLVSESAEAEQGGVKVSSSESGAGFGLMGGVDLRLTDLLSLPLEVSYVNAKPADDVSGLGFTLGLTWNFGQMP